MPPDFITFVFKVNFMQQLILKTNISASKMKALILFLKSWGVEAEFKQLSKTNTKREQEFSLSVGLWEDYAIDAKNLRTIAWRI